MRLIHPWTTCGHRRARRHLWARRSSRGPALLLVVLVLMLLLLTTASGCSLSTVIDVASDVLLPSIEPVANTPPVPDAQLKWPFEGNSVTLNVPIDAGVLAGAQASDKSAIVMPDASRGEWLPSYYRAFVDEEDQAALYDALLTGLRSLRASLQLDDDRYAELIITFAQSLEYRTDPTEPAPLFPIETVAAGAGDCDDKTLLAAALLEREGYGVSLLSFEDEQHMALGLRTTGEPYRDTGYGFVEMTTPSLVGWVPDSAGDGGPLRSQPLVIPIGDGTLAYGAADQTEALFATLQDAVAQAEALTPRTSASQSQVEALDSQVASLRAQMDALEAAGRYAEYNAQVPTYNSLVGQLNTLVDAHNALVAEQNAAADRARHILDNQTDRSGLAAWLGAGMP
jgi:hypothetical protein